jgi:hypothetical protein
VYAEIPAMHGLPCRERSDLEMQVAVALRKFSENTLLTGRAAREGDADKFAELSASHHTLAQQVEALRERLQLHRARHRC